MKSPPLTADGAPAGHRLGLEDAYAVILEQPSRSEAAGTTADDNRVEPSVVAIGSGAGARLSEPAAEPERRNARQKPAAIHGAGQFSVFGRFSEPTAFSTVG